MLYTLEEALELFWDKQVRALNTCLPAVVVTVHDNLRVDVQPLLKNLYRDGTVQDRAVILNVPLMAVGTSRTLIKVPLQKGDIVLCIFSQRGLDNFKAGNGDAQAPSDFRYMDKRDAIAIPGLFTDKTDPSAKLSTIPEGALGIIHNIGTTQESSIVIDAAGKQTLTSPVQIEVVAPQVLVTATQTTFVGLVNVNGIDLSTHTHISSAPTVPTGPMI